MSYRDLRNFAEALRELHYSRVVSLENFRQPNFALVAELLFFLLHKAAPDADAKLPHSIDGEEDRVAFVSACCRLAFQTANLNLNPVRLYAADGRSVKELLKLATFLQKAQRLAVKKAEQLRASSGGPATVDVEDELLSSESRVARSQVLTSIGNVRELSSQVTRAGAALNELLEDEKDICTQRATAVGFLDRLGVGGGPGGGGGGGFRHTSTEEQFLQRSLQELVQSMEAQISEKMEELQELQTEDKGLTARIERRQGELERSEKRLRALASVRPQFMDEYEAIEEQMQIYYEQYVIKVRNIAALEQQLREFEEQEKQHMNSAERRRAGLRRVMKEQEQRIFAATHEYAGDSYEAEDPEVVDYAIVEQRSYEGQSVDDSGAGVPSHHTSERAIRQASGRTFQTSPLSEDGSGDIDGDLSPESYESSESGTEPTSDGVSRDDSEATPGSRDPQVRSATRMAEYSQSDNDDDASSDRVSSDSDEDF